MFSWVVGTDFVMTIINEVIISTSSKKWGLYHKKEAVFSFFFSREKNSVLRYQKNSVLRSQKKNSGSAICKISSRGFLKPYFHWMQEQGWAVVPRTKTPREIREEYEALARQDSARWSWEGSYKIYIKKAFWKDFIRFIEGGVVRVPLHRPRPARPEASPQCGLRSTRSVLNSTKK